MITDIRIEDLPSQFRDIAEVVGMVVALKLIECCGGETIYVPTRDSAVQERRNREIYEKWLAGSSYKELTKEYRLSETRIREICSEMRNRHLAPACDLDAMLKNSSD